MPQFEFTLKGFRFPTKLPNNKANFRFVVDLRLIGDDDQFITEHAVMPSLDTFWECDTSRKDKPNYVRAPGNPEFDINKIDAWDRLILRVKAKSVHSIQFKVFDVDRKDAWDKVKNVLGKIIETVIGGIKGSILGKAPFPLPAALGGAADDVQSFLLKKLAGGDKVLFRGSAALTNSTGSGPTVKGLGTDGQYAIDFNVSMPSGPA